MHPFPLTPNLEVLSGRQQAKQESQDLTPPLTPSLLSQVMRVDRLFARMALWTPENQTPAANSPAGTLRALQALPPVGPALLSGLQHLNTEERAAVQLAALTLSALTGVIPETGQAAAQTLIHLTRLADPFSGTRDQAIPDRRDLGQRTVVQGYTYDSGNVGPWTARRARGAALALTEALSQGRSWLNDSPLNDSALDDSPLTRTCPQDAELDIPRMLYEALEQQETTWNPLDRWERFLPGGLGRLVKAQPFPGDAAGDLCQVYECRWREAVSAWQPGQPLSENSLLSAARQDIFGPET